MKPEDHVDAAGADSYVLCEINASSCFAIPEEAPAQSRGR
ncbi:protein of unknown function [Bradyrhizobium vignae]|uniref:Uncharacterized protein n=1 Tax=Bradyrhizobium vignae TaxID=1549949 RepID=A0A2U3Q550_9BRAD|nr:protein of unknown function [Bradyrhizobium vignae]